MTNREQLLQAVLDNPADDMTRLVFADWLEENGEPDRAEFIRIQIELAPHEQRRAWLKQMPVEQWAGPNAEGELLRKLAPLVRREHEIHSTNWHIWWPQKWDKFQPLYRRGFIFDITCFPADWFTHHQTITSQHPIEKVRLTEQLEVQAVCSLDSFSYEIFGCKGSIKISNYVLDTEPQDEVQIMYDILALNWPRIEFILSEE